MNWNEVKIDEKMRINSRSGTSKTAKRKSNEFWAETTERKKERRGEVNVCITKSSRKFHWAFIVAWSAGRYRWRRAETVPATVDDTITISAEATNEHEKKEDITICLPLFSLCGKSICNDWYCMKMLSPLLRSHFVEWVCNIEYNLHIMAYPVRWFGIRLCTHSSNSCLSAQRYFVRLVASVSGSFILLYYVLSWATRCCCCCCCVAIVILGWMQFIKVSVCVLLCDPRTLMCRHKHECNKLASSYITAIRIGERTAASEWVSEQE